MNKQSKEEIRAEKLKAQQKENRTKLIKVFAFAAGMVAVVALIALIIQIADGGKSKETSDQVSASAQTSTSTYVAATDVDYTTCIDEKGNIKDLDLSKAMSGFDYKGLKVKKSEVAADEEKIASSLESLRANNPVLNKGQVAVKDGDKINLDYSGSVDGVVFDGGTAQDQQLTIGSNTFIDTFEEQLIGHMPGETLDVLVTFPETYDNNPDLAGKAAKFVVTINGIYEEATLTDEFIKNTVDGYDTLEAYTEYLRNVSFESNVETYIKTAAVEACTFNTKKFSKQYTEYLEQTFKKEYETQYQYYNYMYQIYLGQAMWSSFEDYLSQNGLTVETFEEKIKSEAEQAAKFYMVMQYVANEEKIVITDVDIRETVLAQGIDEEDVDARIESVGRGVWAQETMARKAIEVMRANITIEE